MDAIKPAVSLTDYKNTCRLASFYVRQNKPIPQWLADTKHDMEHLLQKAYGAKIRYSLQIIEEAAELA